MVTIKGTAFGENYGCYLAPARDWNDNTAKDWNGDGYDDVVVGAPQSGTIGYVAVYSGAVLKSGGSLNSNNGILFQYFGANPDDEFGDGVALMGDLDNDHHGEILVTAPDADSGKGRIYVIQGGVISPQAPQVKSFTTTDAGAHLGADGAVSYIGKVAWQGNNYYAVAVGAPCVNKVYIYGTLFGQFSWASSSFTLLTAINGTTLNLGSGPGGLGPNPDFGRAVLGMGDVVFTGAPDGYGDFLVGAPDACKNAQECASLKYTGAVVAFSGNGLTRQWYRWGELWQGNNNPTFRRPQFGYTLGKAGDWDNNGKQDVIVGAYNSYSDILGGQGGFGRAYIYEGYGGRILYKWQTAYYSDTVSGYNYFGYSVAGGVDFGLDGYGDVIVGTPFHKHSEFNGASTDYWIVGRVLVLGGNNGTAPQSELDCVECNDPRACSCPPCKTCLKSCAPGTAYCPRADIFLDALGKKTESDGAANSFAHAVYACQLDANGQEVPASSSNSSRGLGYRVAVIGDINGDGHMDVAASSPGIDVSNPLQQSNEGMVKIYASFRLGDVNNDNVINISDVTYLNNYVNSGGCQPRPFCESGDTNHDGHLDGYDVQALTDYLFNGTCAELPCNCSPVNDDMDKLHDLDCAGPFAVTCQLRCP